MAIRQADSEELPKMPRWKKIMELPDETLLWNLETGDVFRKRQLRPVYASPALQIVNDFQILGDETKTIPVAFVRLENEGFETSIRGTR